MYMYVMLSVYTIMSCILTIYCSDQTILYIVVLRWDCCWSLRDLQWRWECGWRKVRLFSCVHVYIAYAYCQAHCVIMQRFYVTSKYNIQCTFHYSVWSQPFNQELQNPPECVYYITVLVQTHNCCVMYPVGLLSLTFNALQTFSCYISMVEKQIMQILVWKQVSSGKHCYHSKYKDINSNMAFQGTPCLLKVHVCGCVR